MIVLDRVYDTSGVCTAQLVELCAPGSRFAPVICWQDLHGIYTLHEAYPLRDPLTGGMITYPIGVQWDGHSVPWLAQKAIPPYSLGAVPALAHDMDYRFMGRLPREWMDPYVEVDRAGADERYRLLVLASGAVAWRRRAAYTAVRAFGGGAWGALPPEPTHPRAYRMEAA